MAWLITGLLVWTVAHLFKRMAPGPRAAMGDAGKGVIALALLVGVVLMVIGYRQADGTVFWGRSPATTGVNNLIMLVSVYLFAASGMKTALARRMRHPMLVAVMLWAAAHLLVNGNVPSIVLFGGLLAWAVVEVVAINRAVPGWTPPPPAPAKREVMALAGTVVVYAVIAGVHYWLGYPVFG